MTKKERLEKLQKATEYCMLEISRLTGDIYRFECFRAIVEIEQENYLTEIKKLKGE